MRIAIVEDHSGLRKTLKQHLSQLPYRLEVVFEAASVSDAVKGFITHQIDLAILDVEIQEGLIFDVLNQLPSLDFEILFLSAHGSYAINAFEYNALSFILKPLDYSALEKQFAKYYNRKAEGTAVSALKTQLEQLEKILKQKKVEKIALPSTEGISFYRFDEISWIQADANYCNFILKTGKKSWFQNR